MGLDERVRGAEGELSRAERQVAEAVLAEPTAVAFGTVAGLARRAHTGTATVVRLAAKLGYQGYGGLQAAVRAELTDSLRPAAERIREPAPDDVLSRTLNAELDNVHTTLAAIDPPMFAAAVRLLSRRSARVFVASGDSSAGVAALFGGHLGMLRPGVALVGGTPVGVALQLATASPGDVLVTIDFRRYDRWLLDTVARATRAGLEVVALTDSPLSPLARHAAVVFGVSAASAGPFDSHVGALALTNALLAGIAARLRAMATERLRTIEAAWHDALALAEV